jgi:hypothetical protein
MTQWTSADAKQFNAPDDMRLAELLLWAIEEARIMQDTAATAVELQWTAPTVRRSSEDDGPRQRATVSNPTFDVATDERRLKLRAQVVASERVIRKAIIALRGARLGLEATLEDYSN